MSTMKYIVKERRIKYIEFEKEIEENQIIIMKRYKSKKGIEIEIPSCLNGFLDKWKTSSINNSKNLASTLCSFLNYVKVQVEKNDDEAFINLEDEGLFGLNYYHIANYLNYCIITQNTKYSTIKQYEKRLLAFYDFLYKNKVLVLPEEYENKSVSDFYTIHYPQKTNVKLTKMVNMDEHLWQLFLQVSQKYTPDLTFGIALQMFGGLRRGEVVNLTIESILMSRTRDKSKMDLLIKDNFLVLFKNRPEIDTTKCQVKRPRPQVVFNFDGELYEYYEEHLKYRNKILKNTRKNTEALFVDSRGLAMSGTLYEKRWSKTKKQFLEALKKNSFGVFSELSQFTWGTHIGRGIFTNLCLDNNLAKDSRELANLRGDVSTDAAQAYIDEFRQRKLVNKALENISEKVGEKDR